MVKITKVKGAAMPLVYELLQDIRKPDMVELLMGPTATDRAVYASIANSRHCLQVRDKEHNLLAIFGIAAGQINVGGTQATPIWFLGTNKAYRHNRALVYYGREYCSRFIAECGPLCNFIWAGNEPALRYIRHLGAHLLDAVPLGNTGEMFIPFILSEVI